MPRITQKTILITGASSGLGRGLAVALAAGQNRLIITARRAPLLEEVAAEVRAAGSACLVVPSDVTDAAASQAVIDAAIERFGGIDVAVLNAGGGNELNMATASIDEVLWMMRLNYDGLVHYLVPLIAHMKGRGGLIAHTGSPAGFFGLPKAGPYSAAKAAGRMLMDACRVELRGSGIDLIALYPGFTLTPGIDPDIVPHKALLIQTDRAVKEMVRALEQRKSHHLFPKRIASLMAFGRALPEPVRRWILQRAS